MLIDSHCHIDFKEFDADRADVIRSARGHGVVGIVVPATCQSTWLNTIEVCAKYQLHLALGLHPLFIGQHQPQHLVELKDLCDRVQPKAIGEIGLDFYHKSADKDKQLAYFSKQLIIAKQQELPVIVHCRKAHDECLCLIQDLGLSRGGIIHAFNGSIQQAEKYIESGFLLGFGGMLTYERSRKLRQLAEQIPLTSIALETDAPDMTVAQHQGSRNSPEYLPFVAMTLSKIKARTLKEVQEITSSNVRQLLLLEQF